MPSPSPTSSEVRKFQKIVWDYYRTDGRKLPWRENLDPYAILVSEMMLQQTQVGRVITKYQNFMELFPNFSSLASASSAQVVAAWSGLGYNRRALFLQQAAKVVCSQHAGKLPPDVAKLEELPGIGPATARSIAAFAFNEPVAFIETNIRRVFIYHFFPAHDSLSDSQLLPLVAATLPHGKSREWYWALMDYGTHLARKVVNPNRRSRHYVRQSRFEGSRRQARGAILRTLLDGPRSLARLAAEVGRPKTEVRSIANELINEGFIVFNKRRIQLKS